MAAATASAHAVVDQPRARGEAAKTQLSEADRVVEAIGTAAKTGQIGDGKIFVVPLDHAVRIRTSETDSDAL